MSERCEKHDLSGCADCHPERLPQPHIPKVVRDKMGPERPQYGPWFEARFDSDCDECGGLIEEGGRVRSDGEGGWLCEDCGGAVTSDVDEVGRWRFCPVCGGPVANHPAGLGPRVGEDGAVLDEDLEGDGYEDVVCASCVRPWPACPCWVMRRRAGN